jgi:hypothetical protein
MTFITGKHISRRMLLRGAGASIALPLLDAMHPALAAPSKVEKQARRVGVVYVPNGIVMKDWKVASAGTDFAFTRILKPLEPFRKDITLLSGLANQAAGKARGGGHAKATGSFLSATPPKFTAGPDVRSGVTFDQVAAKQFAAETRVASLQLGCEDSPVVERSRNAACRRSESAFGLRTIVRNRRSQPFTGNSRSPDALSQEYPRHDA